MCHLHRPKPRGRVRRCLLSVVSEGRSPYVYWDSVGGGADVIETAGWMKFGRAEPKMTQS